eukprot:26880-Hanusia_phi.AAC.1
MFNQLGTEDGFEAFDLDKDGVISLQDFKAGSQQLQLGLADSDLESWFNFASRNHQGGILIEAWNLLLDDANAEDILRSHGVDLDETLANASEGLTLASTKKLDPKLMFGSDLAQVSNAIAAVLKHSQLQIEEGFREFDCDGDGKVSQNDFLESVEQLNLGLHPTVLLRWYDELCCGEGAISKEMWIFVLQNADAQQVLETRIDSSAVEAVIRHEPKSDTQLSSADFPEPSLHDFLVGIMQLSFLTSDGLFVCLSKDDSHQEVDLKNLFDILTVAQPGVSLYHLGHQIGLGDYQDSIDKLKWNSFVNQAHATHSFYSKLGWSTCNEFDLQAINAVGRHILYEIESSNGQLEDSHRMYDFDGDGIISKTDLLRALGDCGERLSESKISIFHSCCCDVGNANQSQLLWLYTLRVIQASQKLSTISWYVEMKENQLPIMINRVEGPSADEVQPNSFVVLTFDVNVNEIEDIQLFKGALLREVASTISCKIEELFVKYVVKRKKIKVYLNYVGSKNVVMDEVLNHLCMKEFWTIDGLKISSKAMKPCDVAMEEVGSFFFDEEMTLDDVQEVWHEKNEEISFLKSMIQLEQTTLLQADESALQLSKIIGCLHAEVDSLPSFFKNSSTNLVSFISSSKAYRIKLLSQFDEFVMKCYPESETLKNGFQGIQKSVEVDEANKKDVDSFEHIMEEERALNLQLLTLLNDTVIPPRVQSSATTKSVASAKSSHENKSSATNRGSTKTRQVLQPPPTSREADQLLTKPLKVDVEASKQRTLLPPPTNRSMYVLIDRTSSAAKSTKKNSSEKQKHSDYHPAENSGSVTNEAHHGEQAAQQSDEDRLLELQVSVNSLKQKLQEQNEIINFFCSKIARLESGKLSSSRFVKCELLPLLVESFELFQILSSSFNGKAEANLALLRDFDEVAQKLLISTCIVNSTLMDGNQNSLSSLLKEVESVVTDFKNFVFSITNADFANSMKKIHLIEEENVKLQIDLTMITNQQQIGESVNQRLAARSVFIDRLVREIDSEMRSSVKLVKEIESTLQASDPKNRLAVRTIRPRHADVSVMQDEVLSGASDQGIPSVLSRLIDMEISRLDKARSSLSSDMHGLVHSILKQINIALDYNHLDVNSGFLAFDKDSDQRISLKDLTTSLKELNIHCLESDIATLMTFMDKDKDGYINFEEWRSALHAVYCLPNMYELFQRDEYKESHTLHLFYKFKSEVESWLHALELSQPQQQFIRSGGVESIVGEGNEETFVQQEPAQSITHQEEIMLPSFCTSSNLISALLNISANRKKLEFHQISIHIQETNLHIWSRKAQTRCRWRITSPRMTKKAHLGRSRRRQRRGHGRQRPS